MHLQEVNHDEHLWVRWQAETLPDGVEALRLNQAWQHKQQQEAKLDNFGIHKLEKLLGSVGYIDIHYLHHPAWATVGAMAVMSFLSSKVTFSTGELFAHVLQTRHRAIVVGEKTDGGAHPCTSFRIHPHFELSIPIGRTINPATGIDWEGSDILPDIAVPSAESFKLAYKLALQSILANAGSSSIPEPTLSKAQAALENLEST